MSHTAALTRRGGPGIKPNVIPGSAEAILNARLLPGKSVDDFIAAVARVIDNPNIKIEIVHRLPPPPRPGPMPS